jgi:hypothetical protein
MLIVFICHDKESVQSVPKGHPILFVGNKEVDEDIRKRVIVVRELPIHIEHIPKLLTFTAWYSIVKNDLFLDFEYLCLLEWDAVLDPTFEEDLKALCHPNVHAISFMESGLADLLSDIHIDVFFKFLRLKGCSQTDILTIRLWGISSNQCLRRTLLVDFVEWYYPACQLILDEDPDRVSWYHERVYMVYLNYRKIPYQVCRSMTHLFKNSHKELNKKE